MVVTWKIDVGNEDLTTEREGSKLYDLLLPPLLAFSALHDHAFCCVFYVLVLRLDLSLVSREI